MLTDPAKLQEFADENEVDFSFAVPGLARFRVNAFRQRCSISIVCRAIPFEIETVEDLLLPPVTNELADEERGIILLTARPAPASPPPSLRGSTGSTPRWPSTS